MPVSLLLDSSDQNLSVGFAREGKVFAKVSYEAWQRQSELLVAEIDRLMKDNGISRNDIDSVVVGKGPGSYTGVRIAMSVAKVIALALQIPLYTASSLEILKNPSKTSLCLVNARSKRSYVGVYGKEAIEEDTIWANAEVLEYIAAHPEVAVCGDTAYLGIEGERHDVLENLALCIDDAHKVENALGAKPVYLKDSYEKGKFKTVVRKLMPADFKAVMGIENECFAHPYDENQMLYEINENPVAYLYVAVVDHEVVGFIDFYITFNSATICQIAVKKEFRRKGIAQLLWKQMEKDFATQAEPIEFLTLEVRTSNDAARAFYKKNGLEEITIKKQYYDDGEDAAYMVRSYVND